MADEKVTRAKEIILKLKEYIFCSQPTFRAMGFNFVESDFIFLNNLIDAQEAAIVSIRNEAVSQLGKTVEARDERDELRYILQGVMLSVDKWLIDKELEQDEVNRAATMREKTLRIVEGKDAVINAQADKIRLLEQALVNKNTELERLKG